jgi:hypothetical protein
MILPRVVLTLIVLMTALLGCRKPAVESYRVPKEPVAQTSAAPNDATHAGIGKASAGSTAPASSGPASAGGAMANTAVPTASGADLVWSAPANWKVKPASSMRKGSFALTAPGVEGEADLSITAFPGAVGGDLANVNRWRSQINLAPVSAADFASSSQKLERNGLKMTAVDLTGKNEKGAPTRVLGAMIPHGGSTWFVKLSGPEAIVAREKDAFMKFLETLKPAPDSK